MDKYQMLHHPIWVNVHKEECLRMSESELIWIEKLQALGDEFTHLSVLEPQPRWLYR